MFPLDLAERGMSLVQGEERCAVSLTAVLNQDGHVDEYWMGPSTVRTTHRMTDREAEAILATSPGEHPGLTLLMEAADRRARYRAENGAVTISMPEPEVKVKRRSAAFDASSAVSVDLAAVGVGEGDGDSDKENIRGGDNDDDDTTSSKDGAADGVAAAARVEDEEHGRNPGERAANAVRELEAKEMEVTVRRFDGGELYTFNSIYP
jgi:hypothetical protein